MPKPKNGDWIFRTVVGLVAFLGTFWFYRMSDDLKELTKANQKSAERLARIEVLVEAQREEIRRLHGVVDALRNMDTGR